MIRKGSSTDLPRRTVVAVILALTIPVAIPAGERHPGTKVAGVVTALDPGSISILGDGGKEVTVQTAEDLTERVTVGSEVTLWYSPKRGANVLEWVDTPPETFFVPASEIRERITKIIILPKSEVPGADGLFEAMSDYLESHTSWYAGSPLLAAEIRDRTLKAGVTASTHADRSTLDAIDPTTGQFDLSRYTQGSKPQNQKQAQPQPHPTRSAAPPDSTLNAIDESTGQFDMDRYLRAQAEAQAHPQPQPTSQPAVALQAPRDEGMIPRVASETRVDAVLEVNVVEVQAALSRLVARWDGAEEPIAGKGSETIAKLALGPGRGAVPATTVILRLWDSQGNLLWSKRAGFAVLAVSEGLRGKLRERPLPEVLANRTAVDKWLGNALAPLLSDAVSARRKGRKQ